LNFGLLGPEQVGGCNAAKHTVGKSGNMQALAHIKKNSSDLAVVKQLVDQAYARTRTYLRSHLHPTTLSLSSCLLSLACPWRPRPCSATCPSSRRSPRRPWCAPFLPLPRFSRSYPEDPPGTPGLGSVRRRRLRVCLTTTSTHSLSIRPTRSLTASPPRAFG